jgi:AcrR family transcriptional regulator
MKVSKEKKVEIARDLLDAAVALFTEKGFQGATMREISSRAGYSAGTIYSYFPSKEKIFYAYFDQKQSELDQAIGDINDYKDYNLKEKLQALMETQLELFTPDREFVEITYKALLDSPMKSFTELRPAKERFGRMVARCFASAVERKEIPSQPFEGFLINLFWDYRNLMVLYWLKDDSHGFTNTSRLIDMSLDIYVDVVKSTVITKFVDIFTFLLKSHLYGNIDKLAGLMDVLGHVRHFDTGHKGDR